MRQGLSESFQRSVQAVGASLALAACGGAKPEIQTPVIIDVHAIREVQQSVFDHLGSRVQQTIDHEGIQPNGAMVRCDFYPNGVEMSHDQIRNAGITLSMAAGDQSCNARFNHFGCNISGAVSDPEGVDGEVMLCVYSLATGLKEDSLRVDHPQAPYLTGELSQ